MENNGENKEEREGSDDTTTDEAADRDDSSTEAEEVNRDLNEAISLDKGNGASVRSNSPHGLSSSSSKMRIKLKMTKISKSKISASGLPVQDRLVLPLNGEAPKRKNQSDGVLPVVKSTTLLPSAATEQSESNSGSSERKQAEKTKTRIRSLKLPLSKKVSSIDSIHAAVENSDNEDVEVMVTPMTVSSTATLNSGSSKSGGKRKSLQTARVRVPALLSPGLLVPGLYSSKQQQLDSFSTPAQVFDQAMTDAGYTEARTKRPHRGSSTRRVVGDMYDSNIKLCIHFPPLVPPKLWDSNGDEITYTPTDDQVAGGKSDRSTKNVTLQDRVIRVLRNGETGERKPRKRPRASLIREMLPVSLTIPYPESYIQKQLEYVRHVEEREEAIRRKQEAELEADLGGGDSILTQVEVDVPDIPRPPSPPKMTDVPGFLDDHKDQHPLYLPDTQRSFVLHLDKECFHVTEGRYFGLATNKIADPLFCGANAPGISGVNAASGAGLATATASATATSFILTSAFYDTSPDAKVRKIPDSPIPDAKQSTDATLKISAEVHSEAEVEDKHNTKKVSSPPSKTVVLTSFQPKLMDEHGSSSSSMLRQTIIRAAVHASRTGKHGQEFRVGDKVFPDVSKAFAAHAGIKPCLRCKNNKQGAYHCRLRRRHLENDFDDGESAKELRPLFELPLDELM